MLSDHAAIDYLESGSGPAIVLVPGSCSTGVAWRPLIATWNNQFRSITTSLPGYGGTAERRTTDDASFSYLAETIEAVIQRADDTVHLVGHSAGAMACLAVALRNRVQLSSLVVIEAPAVELLRSAGEDKHYETFRRMTSAYFADFAGGNKEAIGSMIDFYGGAGTFLAGPGKFDRTRSKPHMLIC